ncbi:LacI family DNA-binding transcriptional regulator [Sinomonas sp. G460-2]|uniref:LacI family DNA-binding transcriptional regulator n=1 Tax=Sinomonas sp. G460-2 TaxID=3393464 RepID=UPI0039EE4F1D
MTIADVAALAGVSPAAVSKVFNSTGSISPATAARIREAAEKLNWTPSPAAVALRQSKTKAIGLVLNRPRATLDLDMTDSLLLSGIETVLAPREWGLLLYLFDRASQEQVEFYRRLVTARRVDGLILANTEVGDPRFELLRSLHMPAFLIGTPWNEDPIPHVDSSPPHAGVAETVQHLLDLGHRRIAYVGGPPTLYLPLLRREAFGRSVEAAGLTPAATFTADHSPATAAEATRRLMAQDTPPTALVFETDTMAIGGMRQAKSMGLNIPRDLSIVGYGGTPMGEWLEPPLTTVDRHSFNRGQAAAAGMMALLGEPIDPEDHPLRQPELVVRSSTALAPTREGVPTLLTSSAAE